MVEQIFLSPQLKRSVIISNKLVIPVAPRAAERIKAQDLRKFGGVKKKTSKLHRIIV